MCIIAIRSVSDINCFGHDVVDDLKVTYIGVEKSAGEVSVSGAEAVLPKL